MIVPGQIYRAADGSGTLIRIILAPEIILGRPYGTAIIETVLATGRGVRRRPLFGAALHTNSLNGGGRPWRTGYVLEPGSAHATPDSAGHDRTPADNSPDTATDTPDVRPGQVWQDNDPRGYGRQLRIESTGDTHAECREVTVTPQGAVALVSGARTRTRIRLDRFRPTSTGYRLIQDAEPA